MTETPTYPNDPTVLGLLVSNWLDSLEELGFEPAPLLSGVADRAELRRLGARLRWSRAAEVLDRAMTLYGAEVVERAGEVHATRATVFGALSRLLVRPSAFYVAAFSGGRYVWPLERVRVELRGRDVFHELHLAAHIRPAEGFFVTSIGTLRSLLRVVGLPDCEVEATISPTHGVYRARLPAEALVRRPLRVPRAGAMRTLLDQLEPYGRGLTTNILHEILARMGATDASQTLVLDLQRDFGLTRAEARVAARLASGMRVSDIALALRVRESTVHAHLRSTFRKVGVNRQAELVALVRASVGKEAAR